MDYIDGFYSIMENGQTVDTTLSMVCGAAEDAHRLVSDVRKGVPYEIALRDANNQLTLAIGWLCEVQSFLANNNVKNMS